MQNRLKFWKFDGAGNDFVIIDNRERDPQLTTEQVARICHRRFGVGADGLMSIDRGPEGYDFEMKYYNSDGRLGSMCGNGGRCIVACAYMLEIIDGSTRFLGYDGSHEAKMIAWDREERRGVVELGMRDVKSTEVRRCLEGWFLDTGSPHYVQWVSDLDHFDVVGEGRRLRHHEEFPQGTNVDFIEKAPDGTLKVRTYERGVEDETWACGTGVTACAIVSGIGRVTAVGGDFEVRYARRGDNYEEVRLIGPVSCNFEGEYGFIQ